MIMDPKFLSVSLFIAVLVAYFTLVIGFLHFKHNRSFPSTRKAHSSFLELEFELCNKIHCFKNFKVSLMLTKMSV